MSVEEAIAAAQSFSANLDARFAAERSAIESQTAVAKEKLVSGLLDLKEQAKPQAPAQPEFDPFASSEAGAFDAAPSNGEPPPFNEADFDPFADVAAPAQAAAPSGGVSFDDFPAQNAPEPSLDMPLGEDDVILDDDGIPTWQEP